jgi:hypothetical protein
MPRPVLLSYATFTETSVTRSMPLKENSSAGEGLERSCQGAVAGWIASTGPVNGVELFRAWFAGEAYQRHRHDTYAAGVTDSGVQVFDHRGAVHHRFDACRLGQDWLNCFSPLPGSARPLTATLHGSIR